jgi:hypothetical protein
VRELPFLAQETEEDKKKQQSCSERNEQGIEDKGNNKKQHVESEMSKEKRRMRDVRRLVSSCGDCVCACGAAVATKHPLFCVLILNCQPTSLSLSS